MSEKIVYNVETKSVSKMWRTFHTIYRKHERCNTAQFALSRGFISAVWDFTSKLD